MNVTCPDCRSVYRVDPQKVPLGGVRARCSVCGGVIPVPAPELAMAGVSAGSYGEPASVVTAPMEHVRAPVPEATVESEIELDFSPAMETGPTPAVAQLAVVDVAAEADQATDAVTGPTRNLAPHYFEEPVEEDLAIALSESDAEAAPQPPAEDEFEEVMAADTAPIVRAPVVTPSPFAAAAAPRPIVPTPVIPPAAMPRAAVPVMPPPMPAAAAGSSPHPFPAVGGGAHPARATTPQRPPAPAIRPLFQAPSRPMLTPPGSRSPVAPAFPRTPVPPRLTQPRTVPPFGAPKPSIGAPRPTTAPGATPPAFHPPVRPSGAIPRVPPAPPSLILPPAPQVPRSDRSPMPPPAAGLPVAATPTEVPSAPPAAVGPASIPPFTRPTAPIAARPTPPGVLPGDVRRRVINPFLNNDPNQKAKRLARALVSDMVVYLPKKREEGLANGTLKQVFREEIKKSYEEYVDQIGKEFAESTTHFQDALNDILALGKKIF